MKNIAEQARTLKNSTCDNTLSNECSRRSSGKRPNEVNFRGVLTLSIDVGCTITADTVNQVITLPDLTFDDELSLPPASGDSSVLPGKSVDASIKITNCRFPSGTGGFDVVIAFQGVEGSGTLRFKPTSGTGKVLISG